MPGSIWDQDVNAWLNRLVQYSGWTVGTPGAAQDPNGPSPNPNWGGPGGNLGGWVPKVIPNDIPDPPKPPGKPIPKGPLPGVVFISNRLQRDDMLVNGRVTTCATENAKHIQWKDEGTYVSLLRGYILDFHVLTLTDRVRAARIGLKAFYMQPDHAPPGDTKVFGQYTTAFANTVKSFKTVHHILGPGQTAADTIVGIKTIRFIDALMVKLEKPNG